MDSIAISGTLAVRIGTSFLKNENYFWQAMKQKVLLERMFNRKSYKRNRNFSNSCHKNPEFFFSRTRTLFGRQWNRRFFWNGMFNYRSYEKNRNFRIRQISGRISHDQNFIKLTFIASNFDNYRLNYLIKSDKTLL